MWCDNYDNRLYEGGGDGGGSRVDGRTEAARRRESSKVSSVLVGQIEGPPESVCVTAGNHRRGWPFAALGFARGGWEGDGGWLRASPARSAERRAALTVTPGPLRLASLLSSQPPANFETLPSATPNCALRMRPARPCFVIERFLLVAYA